MYTFRLSAHALLQFRHLANRAAKPGIFKAFEELAKDPFNYKRLKPTNKALLGTYYINVNWYAITLNVDPSGKTVDVLMVLPKALLNRMLNI
jgi:hypothetical protein